MTEKFLRKLIRDVILEGEMEKFLVKGLQRADSLEKGYKYDEDEDNDDLTKKTRNKKETLESLLFKGSVSDFKNELSVSELEKKLNKLSGNNSKELKDLFINLHKFFSNSSNYNFKKINFKLTDAKILKSFADEGIQDILQKYEKKIKNFERDKNKNIPEEIKIILNIL